MRCKLAICGLAIFIMVTRITATDPPQGYEPKMKPGGFAGLDRIPFQIQPHFEDSRSWRIPAGIIRKLYDAKGLPESGSTALRPPADKRRWPVQSIKNGKYLFARYPYPNRIQLDGIFAQKKPRRNFG